MNQNGLLNLAAALMLLGAVLFGLPSLANATINITNSSNITLAASQTEADGNTSENPDVTGGLAGVLVPYAESGSYCEPPLCGSVPGTYNGDNLDDGDVGAGNLSDGLYTIAFQSTDLVLDFGSDFVVTSIAIYNGYRNRDDGTYELLDDASNTLGAWSISTTGPGGNAGVDSFWLTFDTPVSTSSLRLRVTVTEPAGGGGSGETSSYREIHVFGVPAVLDSDNDGVPDDEDICEGGDDNVDTDTDAVPDFCDPCPLDAANDADGDGFCADVDTCPGGDDNVNSDGEGLPDFCDVCPFDPENDADADGICESDDNCPLIANENQADQDGDLVGDACDPDIDGDGDLNDADNCPFDANADQADTDGDGAGDVCDDDLDGDGVLDAGDACVPSPVGEAVNADGCSVSDLCPCAHPDGADRWKNHGAYVSCVAHATNDFVAAGLLTEVEKDAIQSAAGASSCGHKNQ